MRNLRNYQKKAIEQLSDTGDNVLSICPGGGKTYTALCYSESNPFKQILILAHATTVLLSQWSDTLRDLGLDYSSDINSNAKYIVTIPQAINNKTISKFDLVIVDEAHEYFFAEDGMVKNIIKKAKPRATLFLTGTPSKFILNGYKPVIISGVEVYLEGKESGENYLANTYFGLVTSSYKIDQDGYNLFGDLLENIELKDKDTEKSLDLLIEEMLDRLKAVSIAKSSPNIASGLSRVGLTKAQKAFGTLGKTLIAARNIAQANIITKKLQAYKVNAVLSDSESDTDSHNIRMFQEDKSVQVLVVVRRGILGFNMPNLINVVDFTMSRNIDRIYQLYARVLRNNGEDKFYFRVCSAVNPVLDSYFVQAAMSLNNQDFISKYNGKNLKSLSILVPKKLTNTAKVSKTKSKNNSTKKDKNETANMLLADQILGLELLSDLVINPKSKLWKEFAYTRYDTIITKLTGKVFEFNYTSAVELRNDLVARGILHAG